MFKKTNLILAVIIFIAAFLRLYHLSSIPPGVNRDEASIGYTAYSLLSTGKDEYGVPYPLSFQSFGDWKLPLYIYISIPFTKIFGLSELAVRLPSALAGIASVVTMYYVALILFKSNRVGLFAAAVLAIMPWHIHISRVESEANVASWFVLCGLFLFFKALQKKSVSYLTYSAFLFSLTYYTYHGNHIFTTLLLFCIMTLHWKQITKIQHWWLSIVVGAFTVGFILWHTLLGADTTKIFGISIFGDPTVVHYQIEKPRLTHDVPNSILSRIVHNKITYALTTIYQNYLKSFGPEFLFIRGGTNSAHNIVGYGNLHYIEAPLLILGLYWLLRNRKNKSAQLVILWIAVSAVSAAITKDAPHSSRMFAATPALAIAVALGILALPKKILMSMIFIGYIGSMTIYLDKYYVHFPKNEAANWGYAYKKLTPILFNEENKSKNIIMSYPETSPYIYILFYSMYPPVTYQKEAVRYPITRDGFLDVAQYGRFSFRPIDWHHDIRLPNTIIVSKPDEVLDEYKQYITQSIVTPDGIKQYSLVKSIE